MDPHGEKSSDSKSIRVDSFDWMLTPSIFIPVPSSNSEEQAALPAIAPQTASVDASILDDDVLNESLNSYFNVVMQPLEDAGEGPTRNQPPHWTPLILLNDSAQAADVSKREITSAPLSPTFVATEGGLVGSSEQFGPNFFRTTRHVLAYIGTPSIPLPSAIMASLGSILERSKAREAYWFWYSVAGEHPNFALAVEPASVKEEIGAEVYDLIRSMNSPETSLVDLLGLEGEMATRIRQRATLVFRRH